MPEPAPQPNILVGGQSGGFSARFWMLAAITGIAAGIGGGVLMALLRAVRRFAWSYTTGDFLHGAPAPAAILPLQSSNSL